MIQKLYTCKSCYCDVYFDDEKDEYYLDATCPQVAWYSVCVRMTASEAERFRDDPESVQDLALKVCYRPSDYKDRTIPEEQAIAWAKLTRKA